MNVQVLGSTKGEKYSSNVIGLFLRRWQIKLITTDGFNELFVLL